MKKIILSTLLLASFFLFTQCNSSKGTTAKATKGVKFIQADKLSTVLDRAEAEGKIVFIDFYATWCQPCKMMDKDVFSDKNIASFFNENFISYKVDAEKGFGPNIAALYNVRAYPTLVWVDTKGNVLEETVGGTYHTELMKLAEQALANSGQ